jgi:hypothetical protein
MSSVSRSRGSAVRWASAACFIVVLALSALAVGALPAAQASPCSGQGCVKGDWEIGQYWNCSASNEAGWLNTSGGCTFAPVGGTPPGNGWGARWGYLWANNNQPGSSGSSVSCVNATTSSGYGGYNSCATGGYGAWTAACWSGNCTPDTNVTFYPFASSSDVAVTGGAGT